MPRRRIASRREILPDPKFGSDTIAKFINMIMEDGKKSVAERIIYGALDRVSEKKGSESLGVLQQAMENTELFPNMVIQMIAVGEESGSLDDMSAKVADFYEEDVDNAVDNLSSLLEPMIMAILGVLVGGLVVAMYLPIFKLGAVV